MPSSLSAAFAYAVETTSPRFVPLSSSNGSSTTSPPNPTITEPVQSAVPEPEPGHFYFVVSDPVAIYYLDQDPCVKIVKSQLQLEGYELYLVEQWACSRSNPSFTIATYTGHPSHRIFVGLLSIDKEESHWGKELAGYFRFVRHYGREKQTPLGTLMVMNLSNLSSDLSVIAVSDGDVLKHKEDFIVNEDLKRMGCSGRIALTLSVPNEATQAKFHQLFRTCERVPFYTSVIELVRLSQLALVMFQKLDKHFADGLLCDETERAINKWWAEFGADFYNTEPSDGILGPTTVAALLGMMIGARNRLSLCGAPVPKDAFDLPALKGAIGYFQKQQKLKSTRRLDRETVDRLHRITIKGSSGDKYGMVPKAIKSTVAEMSGKTLKVEMETCDLEKFITHLSGEIAKYLWHGKPMKSLTLQNSAMTSSDGGPRRNSAPVTTANGSSHRVGKNLTLITEVKNDSSTGQPGESATSYPLSAPAYPVGQFGFHGNSQTHLTDSRDPLRKAMFKTMNSRMNDAKSGLEKIKDVATGVASGISGQVTKRTQRKQIQDNVPGISEIIQSSEEQKPGMGNVTGASLSAPVLELAKKPSLSLVSHGDQEAARSDPTTIHLSTKNTVGSVFGAYTTDSPTTMSMKSPFQSDSLATSKSDFHKDRDLVSPMTQGPNPEALFEKFIERKPGGTITVEYITAPNTGISTGTVDPSVSGSVQAYEDALEKMAHQSPGLRRVLGNVKGETGGLLARSQSFSEVVGIWGSKLHEEWFPRRMSFSVAEEAVLEWEEIAMHETCAEGVVGKVEDQIGVWVGEKIVDMQRFLPTLDEKIQELEKLYGIDLESYRHMQELGSVTIDREGHILVDDLRDMELLRPKLQYEIGALRGKVDEVEEWVGGLGRQVEELEKRVDSLEPNYEEQGWVRWAWSWTPWGRGS